MEILSTAFSLVLVVFIVSMMLAAGLSATIASLGQVFRKFWLVILALVVNFVLIPLLGWGVAELFALATPAPANGSYDGEAAGQPGIESVEI
jgi:bile acid:Na+ symporter, BASS family